MQRSGFTTIEMVICVILIGIIASIGFPKIRTALDKANVRSSRDALGTEAAIARSAAIQRGCRGVLHFTSGAAATVWVTTACPTKVDTVAGVEKLSTRYNITLVASRDSVQYDPRGLSMDNAVTVLRITGAAGNKDSVLINTIGKVVRR